LRSVKRQIKGQGHDQLMQERPNAIWIKPARLSGESDTSPVETDCGGCTSEELAMAQAVTAPMLSGDPQLIARVFEALQQIQEAAGGHSIIDSGRVQGLTIGDGEATLTLRMGQGLCSDAKRLAEQAFEALRKTLPETDLYLRHDRPVGCAARSAGAAS
jgi:hypothetical protein